VDRDWPGTVSIEDFVFGVLVSLDLVFVFVCGSDLEHHRMQMLLTKSNTPCPEALGSTNGLVQAVMCLARIFSPAFVRYVRSVLIASTIMANVFQLCQRDFCFDR
jgi:hypothetical protein